MEFLEAFDLRLKKGLRHGILVHDKVLGLRLKGWKNNKIDFVKNYSTQAGDHYLFDPKNSHRGWISRLNYSLKKKENEEVLAIIDQIWVENVFHKDEEITSFKGIEPVNLSGYFYDRILVFSALRESKVFEDYFRATYRNISLSRGSKRLDKSVNIIDDRSLIISKKNKKIQIQSTLVEGYDLILIQNHLGWYTNTDEYYDGYNLALDIISSSKVPLNIAFLTFKDHSEVIENTFNMSRHLARVHRHWRFPFDSPLPKVRTSSLKWKTLKLSMSEGGILDKWIHDLDKISNVSDFNGFIDMLQNYPDFVPKRVLNNLSSGVENLDSKISHLKRALRVNKFGLDTAHDHRNIKVLIAEDDPLIGHKIEFRLKGYFANIERTSSALEAKNLIGSGSFDVLISDLEFLKNPENSESAYQEFWGVDLIEHVFNQHPKVVICVLTSMPKATVEGIFNSNRKLKSNLRILFKYQDNDYLPPDYLWEGEIEGIYRSVIEIRGSDNSNGPKNGFWKNDKKLGNFYFNLEKEELNVLWKTVEENVQKPFPNHDWIVRWGKVSNIKPSKELLVKLLTTRVLIMNLFESGESIYWSNVEKFVFKVDTRRKDSVSSSKNKFVTFLGFQYSASAVIEYSRKTIFDQEEKIIELLNEAKKKLFIPSLEEYEDLIITINYIEAEINNSECSDDDPVSIHGSKEVLKLLEVRPELVTREVWSLIDTYLRRKKRNFDLIDNFEQFYYESFYKIHLRWSEKYTSGG